MLGILVWSSPWGSLRIVSARCSCAEEPEEEGREAKPGKSPWGAAEPRFVLALLPANVARCLQGAEVLPLEPSRGAKDKLLVAQVFPQVSGGLRSWRWVCPKGAWFAPAPVRLS